MDQPVKRSDLPKNWGPNVQRVIVCPSYSGKIKPSENVNTEQQRFDPGAPATDSDDLIVLLYFNVVDEDYKDYTYSFKHNNASGKKVPLNKPTETTSAGQKIDLEPSFVVLNFGKRGSLKDEPINIFDRPPLPW